LVFNSVEGTAQPETCCKLSVNLIGSPRLTQRAWYHIVATTLSILIYRCAIDDGPTGPETGSEQEDLTGNSQTDARNIDLSSCGWGSPKDVCIRLDWGSYVPRSSDYQPLYCSQTDCNCRFTRIAVNSTCKSRALEQGPSIYGKIYSEVTKRAMRRMEYSVPEECN